MQFPTIKTLSDIEEVIEGIPEFYIVHMDHFSYIDTGFDDNYQGTGDEEIDAILSECEGLVFYPDGKIAARRFKRFFSQRGSERVDISICSGDNSASLSLGGQGEIVSPIFIGEGIRWVGRNGCNYRSRHAEIIAASNFGYVLLASKLLQDNWSPTFILNVYGSSKPNKSEDLILVGIRHNETGENIDNADLIFLAEKFNVPFADRINTSREDHIMFRGRTKLYTINNKLAHTSVTL